MMKLKPQQVAVAKDMPGFWLASVRRLGCEDWRLTNITDVEREGLGGVGEGHGTFGGRVDGHETEYGGGDGSQLSWVCWVAFGGRSATDQEAEASPEQADSHQGETGQEEIATSEGVDGVDSIERGRLVYRV